MGFQMVIWALKWLFIKKTGAKIAHHCDCAAGVFGHGAFVVYGP